MGSLVLRIDIHHAWHATNSVDVRLFIFMDRLVVAAIVAWGLMIPLLLVETLHILIETRGVVGMSHGGRTAVATTIWLHIRCLASLVESAVAV